MSSRRGPSPFISPAPGELSGAPPLCASVSDSYSANATSRVRFLDRDVTSVRLASRLTGLDAARGTAMVLVCLGHTKEHFITSAPTLYEALVLLTRIATPTFLLLSGLVIAHVLRTSRQSRVGLSLVDRGLFLLLAAHLLIGLHELPEMGLSAWLFERTVITDVMGVALIVAVCVRNASPTALLIAGSAMAFLSWPIGMMLSVDTEAHPWVGMLFSLRSDPNHYLDAPLVSYLGVFLIGMGLSGRFAAEFRMRAGRALSNRLLKWASMSIGIVGIGIAGWVLWRAVFGNIVPVSPVHEIIRQTLDPRTKWPPSPAYVLFYGGVGLAMAAALLRAERQRLGRHFVAPLAVLGRASLMCFVVQDWLLRLFPLAFGFDAITAPAFWIAYFGAAVLLLYWLSSRWDAANWNRRLSVGLRALVPWLFDSRPWELMDRPAPEARTSPRRRRQSQ